MPGEAQPLVSNQRIVNGDGTPTEYFIRWAQDRQIDITAGITLEQAQQAIDDWALAREIIAGAGLTGGGDLSADRTLAVGAGTGIVVGADTVGLANTAVVPGVYGDATHVPQITVDQQGRITNVTLVAITGGGGGPAYVRSAATVANANAAVVLPAAPALGNLLIAVGLHWNNGPTVINGYSSILITNGAARDGLFVAYKIAGAGESATQTPFSYGPNGGQVAVIEVSGASAVPTVLANFQESAADPLVLSGTPATGSLFIGMFGVATSTFDFPIVGATKDATASGATNSNSPRRITVCHGAGTGALTSITADLDAPHDSGGVLLQVT